MKNNFSLKALVRKSIAELTPYSSARQEFYSGGQGMIYLDANENPFGNGLNRYPDPQQRELKAVLAARKGIGPEQLLLGNGSDEVLDLIFRTFCEPGTDSIISLPPTYGMYKVLARINIIENREVVLDENFQPRVPEILKAADENTKMIFLCSPNNPSGNSFSDEKVEALLKGFGGLVVIDEAYIDFSEKESWLLKLEKYPNLVIVQTLSKAYGLAGIRVGIGFASKEIIALLNKIKPPYNINELSQRAALEAVQGNESLEKQIRQLLEQRTFLEAELKELSFVKKVHASEANFILAKVDDAPKRYKELLERGIVVRDRSTQPLCENSLRFTVGSPEENRKLLGALMDIESKH